MWPQQAECGWPRAQNVDVKEGVSVRVARWRDWGDMRARGHIKAECASVATSLALVLGIPIERAALSVRGAWIGASPWGRVGGT
jgi:hypothetical protein